MKRGDYWLITWTIFTGIPAAAVWLVAAIIITELIRW